LDCKSLQNLSTLKPISDYHISYNLKFMAAHLYLFKSVVWFWKIIGEPSWPKVAYFISFFFVLTNLGYYGILRLGMNRAFAALGVACLIYSPHQFTSLISLRDYSVSTFFALYIFFLGLMVLRGSNQKYLLFSGSLAGLALGLGIGFRPDLIVCSPLIFLALLSIEELNSRWRTAGLLCFVITFTTAAFPILSYWIHAQAGNFSHVTILGLTDMFTGSLSISPSVYSFGHFFQDNLAIDYIFSMSAHYLHLPPPVFTERSYELAGMAYLHEIAKVFPADILTRMLASILTILAMPFSDAGALFSRSVFGGHVLGLLCYIAALLFLAKRSIYLFIFVGILILFFGAYPALQMQLRHCFYLEIVGTWCTLFCLQNVFSYLFRKYPSEFPQKKNIIYAAMIIAAVSGLTCLGLEALRVYQSQQVMTLVSKFISAPKLRAKDLVITRQNGAIKINLFGNSALAKSYYQTLVIKIKPSPLSTHSLKMDFTNQLAHILYTKEIPPTESRTLFIHTFFSKHDPKIGTENILISPAMDFQRIESIELVDGATISPLFLEFDLANNWQKRLYQQIIF
jgi:hypothetical protein